MSDGQQSFSWYDPESVRATVTNGIANNVEKSRIAEYLAARQFDDVPLSRVQRIVDTVLVSEDTSDVSVDLSQPETTDAQPRGSLTKQLAVNDLEYVSNREAARLLGLALELFDGNTVRLDGTTEVETDLVWHRQHMSVAIRIIPMPSGSVDTDHIDALLNGTVVPDAVRNPSELAIATNRAFTDDALEYADEHDIHCFDAGHVEEWLRRARIPMDAVGTLLEDGESHDGPLTDLVELPAIPDPRKTADPLDIDRAFDIDSLTTSEEKDETPTTAERASHNRGQQGTEPEQSADSDDPLDDTQSTAGETGTLYADSSEDGDFDAFDRFVDGIKDGTQESTSSSEDDTSPADETAPNSDEDLTTFADVDRKELVFDLLAAKQEAGETMSWKDLRTHGSYPIEYYQKEFGSLANALAAVDVEYTGESQ